MAKTENQYFQSILKFLKRFSKATLVHFKKLTKVEENL